MAKKHSNTKNVWKSIWNLKTELVTDCRSFLVHAFNYKKFMSQILNFVRQLLSFVKFSGFTKFVLLFRWWNPYTFTFTNSVYVNFCFRNRKLVPFPFVAIQIHNWLVCLWNWYRKYHPLQNITSILNCIQTVFDQWNFNRSRQSFWRESKQMFRISPKCPNRSMSRFEQ